MDRPAAGAREAARALAALAVLLGLLAMHGLASTHHAVAAASVQHGAVRHRPAPTAAEPRQHEAIAPVVQDAAARVAAAGAGCDDACPDLTVLCLAVLAGAALLALLLARHHPTLHAAPPRCDLATRAPPARHAKPPDPVRELCVSRT